MNKTLYFRLALRNVKNNKSTFLPFSISASAIIAMFYMLYSIYEQVNENMFSGAEQMRIILNLGVAICGIFSVFVLIYTNGFLMKRRSREFGLYSVLGMEKKHITKIVLWEIVIVALGCITAGILAGIALSKLMFMVLLKILNLKTEFAFGVYPKPVLFSIIVFGLIFAIIIFLNSVRVHRLKPVELIRNENAGEKEPKAKWFLAILGLVTLALGYYLALTAKSPMDAMGRFFMAAICVIMGTYLLFMSVSIALLKILKKNKKFYYDKRHFITVSGMMYRMKQNAAGLATICILSTCVLVVLSTTVSLYVGMEDVLRGRFPRDIITNYLYLKDSDSPEEQKEYNYDYEKVQEVCQNRADEYNVKIKDVDKYYSIDNIGAFQNGKYAMENISSGNVVSFKVKLLEDYDRANGENIDLNKNEVVVYSSDESKINSQKISIYNKEYTIKKKLEKLPADEKELQIYDTLYIVVKDMDVMKEIRDVINENTRDDFTCSIKYNYEFNLAGDFKDKEDFCEGLRNVINNTKIAHTDEVGSIYTSRQNFFGLYGSLFFIGIFIGTMFLITTVMIIYYKQLSEGYQDRKRFEIMKKVGMDDRETKSVIKSQILLVFFLPMFMAVVHICFAFDIIRKMLVSLNFNNTPLYIVCTVIVTLVFFIVYGVVYTITAGTYYRIINIKEN